MTLHLFVLAGADQCQGSAVQTHSSDSAFLQLHALPQCCSKSLHLMKVCARLDANIYRLAGQIQQEVQKSYTLK